MYSQKNARLFIAFFTRTEWRTKNRPAVS